MKRDLQQQFLDFTWQVKIKVWWKCLNAEARLSYMWKEHPVILLLKRRSDLGRDCICLSDRFWDINSPSKEELELFLIEHPEVHQRLFGDKQHG